MKSKLGTFVVLAAAALLGIPAAAQLHWPDPPTKETMRLRVVAIALSDGRSSYFVSHEVLIAEKEIGHEEWSLIKLVYDFLPYQPKLSETGFDYNIVYGASVTRDTSCDETIEELTRREWPERTHVRLQFAQGAPFTDLAERRLPLPCYKSTADDFTNPARERYSPEK